MEREIVLKRDIKIKDRVWKAGRYKVPGEMSKELADWLLEKRPDIAELVSSVPPTPERIEETEGKPDPIEYMQEAMTEAQKFKKDAERAPRALIEEKPAIEASPTQQKTAFDKLLELTGNHLIEIYSDTGNGKSRLVYHIATEAERSGKKVLYLDTEKSLPVGYEKHLKNYEVHTAKTALDLLRQLIARIRRARDEDFNLIVVDSIGLPVLAALPEMDMRERGDAFQLMASLRFQMMGFAFEHGLTIATNQPVSELAQVSVRGKAPKVAAGEPLPPFGGKSEFMAKLILRSEAVQKAPKQSIFKLVVYKAREHGQEYEFARFTVDDKGVSIEWKN